MEVRTEIVPATKSMVGLSCTAVEVEKLMHISMLLFCEEETHLLCRRTY